MDEQVVNIDMAYRSAKAVNVNLAMTSPAIYSTGLYAGAGEKITVMLDDDVKGLTVQIGIHSRDLSSLVGSSYLERDPKVVTSGFVQGKKKFVILMAGISGSNVQATPAILVSYL